MDSRSIREAVPMKTNWIIELNLHRDFNKKKKFSEIDFSESVSEYASITSIGSASLLDLHLQIDFASIRLFCANKSASKKIFSPTRDFSQGSSPSVEFSFRYIVECLHHLIQSDSSSLPIRPPAHVSDHPTQLEGGSESDNAAPPFQGPSRLTVKIRFLRPRASHIRQFPFHFTSTSFILVY